MPKQIQTHTISSPHDMISLGHSLVKSGHRFFLLNGDLGAGKTHISKGIVSGFGLDPDDVQSPTYTYLNHYHKNNISIVHIDMYRIDHDYQLTQHGILEQIDNHDIIIIERPKFIDLYADLPWTTISIEQTGENERVVTITSNE